MLVSWYYLGLLIIGVFCLGMVLSYLLITWRRLSEEKEIILSRESARRLIAEAEKEAEAKTKEIILTAKEEAHHIISLAEKEVREWRNEVQKLERSVRQKEETIDRRIETTEKKEKEIQEKEQEIKNIKDELEKVRIERLKELEKISGLNQEEAKRLLLNSMEKEIRLEAAKLIKDMETQVKKEGDRRAKEIVALAIQRCAVDQVVESSVSVVPLPSDEMKGRLIGREGRNIRAFETLTGVDLIVDDTPEAVVISCFDPIRREVARMALERLILDGRIQPARIEEVVEKAKMDIEEKIRLEGEAAAMKVGVSGLHSEIIKLLGRLHFRTSYGQNVLQNSIESAFLAGSMAAELGVDVMLAKRAALLHDIGKAVSHEVEGSHALIGAELARKYREPKGVVHAISAHHGEEEPQTIEAVLVQVADAISAARPGARRETLESYIKRLEKLEEIADSFPGVEKAYAIQAGREIRIMVKPEEIDDVAITTLARQISKKIEENLQYPGQIKVIVIRETRAIEYAK